ncbi:MAG: hypothetical protein JRI23_35935 [Deltaproteobacteria bacterium]|jgi:hypothetical protein|nr:hypothetical protein [Deltaproteobacteria bacterium]MBW2537737.1 hypothetical protein [Deltaproteobacteria bacterium]
MADLRHIHSYMTARRRVMLDDGTTGRILRLDTAFPGPHTIVSMWTECVEGPQLAKVDIRRVIGLAPPEASASA